MARELALVFAADEAYAIGVSVAMYSALTKLSGRLAPHVYVLDSGLTGASRSRLERVGTRSGLAGRLHWIPVPAERLHNLKSTGFPGSVFIPLLIPELLPRDVRRVVYLDADVMVKRDPSPLFTVELDGAPLGAVRDLIITSTDDQNSGIREPAQSRPYFNSGVMVIDLERWRAMELGSRAQAYASSGGPLRWADQDALNAVTPKWHELDYAWNLQQVHFFRSTPPPARVLAGQLYDRRWDLYRTAAILHFAGPKPWQRFCTTPGTTSWMLTLLRTGWCSPREGLVQLLRYAGNRARYWLGTKRRQWRARWPPRVGSDRVS